MAQGRDILSIGRGVAEMPRVSEMCGGKWIGGGMSLCRLWIEYNSGLCWTLFYMR
jgi:hypothetical protein